VRARVCDGVDAVIHLAAILGGAAEGDPALARRVNLDATLDLFDHLRAQNPATRVVFASTIAVYGKPLPDPVTDATPTAPAMLYGAQKLMIEVALSHLARRGWLDGISLRPAGVMARDGADAGLKSAFMSRLFWCLARGEDITLPVGYDSRTWLTSVDAVAANFLHAALVADLGPERALTLPALSLTFGELVAALRRRFPDSPSRITLAPDPAIVALFGRYPRLDTAGADSLGFVRDADADALVRASMH
jgi:nucleoside-diphosphate-sugar epimerase